MNNTITATVATLLLATTPAPAGSLKKDWVAADARWLIHVDVDGLLNSTVGRFILKHGEQLDLDLDDLDEFTRETGIDPRRDLMGVTVYGTGDEPGEDGVIIAVTNDRADVALERLLDHDKLRVRRRELGGRDVYLVGDKDDRHYLYIEHAGADRRIVVISDDRESFVNALKVIAGRAPSLSMGRSEIPADDPQKGSLVFAAIGNIDAFGDDDPASEILRMSDGITVDIGEIDGTITGLATLSAASPEVAENISQVLTGLIALGRLMATQQEELGPLRELADSVSVRTRDSRISLRIRYDARELMKSIEQMMDMDEHGATSRRHDDDDEDDEGWDDDWDDDEDSPDDDRRHRKGRKRSRDP